MIPTVADLVAEAAELELLQFDETAALRLGEILLDLAKGLPVVISIRTADRTLFHAALPGSTPMNDLWARRKSNTALKFQEASFLVGMRNRAKGETLAAQGLDPAEHADHGGAVPIRVRGCGVVSVATVSGLPQAEDHRLVCRALHSLKMTTGPGE
ncbi:MAG: heme-binding protein [Rhodobacterales bacterium]|nr:heme-binding protein [Rhodobacterales bacterium]